MAFTKLAFIDNPTFTSCLSSLAIFPRNITVAVAVSGGSDSLCLTFLVKAWSRANNLEMVALIVDHKLRANSTEEAKLVYDYLTKNAINAVILTRKESILTTRVQELARKDRYELLKNYCFVHGIPYLFLAHHKDDQLETYLLRKEKGENLVGNAGMSKKQLDEQVITLRPLLDFNKQQLINTLQHIGKSWWVEDPSNINLKYTRVVIRNYINTLTATEINSLQIALQESIAQRIALEKKLLNFLATNVTLDRLGLIKINLIVYKDCSLDLQIMIIRAVLQFISQDYYSINLTKSRNLISNILHNKSNTYTLGKCVIKIKKNFILVFKEPKHINNDVKNCNNYLLWDNRFIIERTLVNNGIITQYNPEFTKKTKKGYILQEYNNYITQIRSFLYTIPIVSKNYKPLKCDNGNQYLVHYYTRRPLVANIFYS